MKSLNRYSALIEHIFKSNYVQGATRVEFLRTEIESAASFLEIKLPKNLGDIVYSFKFRSNLPKAVTDTAAEGKEWVIKNVGTGKYAFEQVTHARIVPDMLLSTVKIPDATPTIVSMFALNDEQALLTKLRYNRLIDIFTGVTCFSLQNHLRTTVPGIGQVETDEIYVGVDKNGRQFVFPVQAKGGKDEIGTVQIEQDFMLCANKYPNLLCRPIAAQFIELDKIAIFEFTFEEGNIRKLSEKHYLLVGKDQISNEEINQYNSF